MWRYESIQLPDLLAIIARQPSIMTQHDRKSVRLTESILQCESHSPKVSKVSRHPNPLIFFWQARQFVRHLSKGEKTQPTMKNGDRLNLFQISSEISGQNTRHDGHTENIGFSKNARVAWNRLRVEC
jgi:hypothetical protein